MFRKEDMRLRSDIEVARRGDTERLRGRGERNRTREYWGTDGGMTSTSLEAYKRAIKHLHRCYANFNRFCPVTVQLDDDETWQGFIAVFDLVGHPTSERCYIWPDHEGSHAWRYTAVLHGDGIDSAEAAVLWAIAQQKKEQSWLLQHA